MGGFFLSGEGRGGGSFFFRKGPDCVLDPFGDRGKGQIRKFSKKSEKDRRTNRDEPKLRPPPFRTPPLERPLNQEPPRVGLAPPTALWRLPPHPPIATLNWRTLPSSPRPFLPHPLPPSSPHPHWLLLREGHPKLVLGRGPRAQAAVWRGRALQVALGRQTHIWGYSIEHYL